MTMGFRTCFFNVHILVCVLIQLSGPGSQATETQAQKNTKG